MNIFREVKETISVQDAYKFYTSNKTKTKGKITWGLCCFHNDKTPNLAMYEGGGFKCYSCNAGGQDSIAFVSKLFNIRPLEAAKKINEDFQLGLQIGQSNYGSTKEMQEYFQDKRLYQRFIEWKASTYHALCEIYKACEYAKKTKEPFSDIWTIACYHSEQADYLLQVLLNGNIHDIIQIFKTYKGRWIEIEGAAEQCCTAFKERAIKERFAGLGFNASE
ncbi:CHC2 zinc finger domain-containing protein [Petroclostridium sp. X23]|uniref:CHC2 zinc finger domain-containing protein n=1 Tax=Petroclostridium sp. X23 TaxID=3045146 RepID=UPI0024AD9C98|nr:CHC2 zinc finger domain-containing protein [Petroclostridium sp. X23]WHH60417.1 CHC2 zinc finger domain-containing protein [Petroclostridium sp. X23]